MIHYPDIAMFRFVLILLYCLAAAIPVWAGQLQDAAAAYEDADYATALRLWRQLAEQGDAEAQYGLGRLYATVRGVPRENARALMWFKLAAAQGVEDAAKLRDSLASHLAPVDIAKAQRMVRRWQAKHGKN